MHALYVIEDEHRTFAALLHAFRYLLREMRERGAPPRHDALGAIVYLLDRYSERLHHPKESEFLFPLLRKRCPAAAPVLDLLDAEHRDGYEAMRRLEQSLTRYRHGGAAEFPSFAQAAETYIDHQYEHMRREEREVLPLARDHLTQDDWRSIDAAFAGDAVPKLDREAAAGYDVLLRRLVAMLPPPVGVGPP